LGGLCVATTSSHLHEEEELLQEEPLEV